MSQPETKKQNLEKPTEEAKTPVLDGMDAGESDPPTSGTQTARKKAPPPHPKGHKVRELRKVWEYMDGKQYLRFSDSMFAEDVWVQPISVTVSSPLIVNATFMYYVSGRHVSKKLSFSKVAADDILAMLYLASMQSDDIYRLNRVTFGQWMLDRQTDMANIQGNFDLAQNHAELARYLLAESGIKFWQPIGNNPRVTVLFRKICCHSYKRLPGSSEPKVLNPNMMKMSAPPTAKKQFDFCIESRLFGVPEEWREPETDVDEEEGRRKDGLGEK